jgi:hypothetical protein
MDAIAPSLLFMLTRQHSGRKISPQKAHKVRRLSLDKNYLLCIAEVIQNNPENYVKFN